MNYDKLRSSFERQIDFNVLKQLEIKSKENPPVNYFDFYNSVSSVYSSKLEGENIDFDSFFKYKFLNVPYKPDYTKRSEDLFNAYRFIQEHSLNKKNIWEAHGLLSKHLLPKEQRGRIRNNPMFVINEEDKIEYVACGPEKIEGELLIFFENLEKLLKKELTTTGVFYYASFIHLKFVKIHPFQDGNGRTARLIEKWFLTEKIGKTAVSIALEKNYYLNRKDYYNNIREIGLEYEYLDYSKLLDFLLMAVNSLKPKK